MTSIKKSALIFSMIALSILISLYLVNAAKTVNSNNDLNEIVMSKVSTREHVPKTDLKVVKIIVLEPENVCRAKVFDKKTGQIYRICLDSQYNTMSEKDVDNLMNNKRGEFIGKLSKRLVEKIENIKKEGYDSRVDVAIWMNADEDAPELPRKTLSDQEKQDRLSEIREFYTRFSSF